MAEAFKLDDGRIALVLDDDEAAVTAMMVGNVSGRGDVRKVVDAIYYALVNDGFVQYPTINEVFTDNFTLTGKGLHESK